LLASRLRKRRKCSDTNQATRYGPSRKRVMEKTLQWSRRLAQRVAKDEAIVLPGKRQFRWNNIQAYFVQDQFWWTDSYQDLATT
jgi:hypothetical protein